MQSAFNTLLVSPLMTPLKHITRTPIEKLGNAWRKNKRSISKEIDRGINASGNGVLRGLGKVSQKTLNSYKSITSKLRGII